MIIWRYWKMTRNEKLLQILYSDTITSSRRPIKSGYDENEISNLISKYTNELKSCTTGEEVQDVVHDFYYDENVSKYVASIRTRSGKPINSFFTTNNPSEIEYTTDWDVTTRRCKVQNLYKLIRFQLNIPYAVQSSRRLIKSDVIIKFEYKDKKYGNPNVKYTQTSIYPSVNEFKKIMDENNIEFRIIRVTPLK